LDEQRNAVDLWSFNNNQNLRQVILEYYLQELETYRSLGGNRLFRVSEIYSASNISIAGKYETGEHGFKTTIYDVEAKAVSHEKGPSEADMLPFMFSFILPNSDLQSKRKKGLLLLARTKTYGVRTLTIPHLMHYIEARFPGYSFNVNRVFPAALAQTLLSQGTLKAIRLIKNRLPNSLEDFLDQDDRSKIQNIEIVVKARRDMSFFSKDYFLQMLAGKGNFRALYESVDMACDNVKLDVEIGGKIRRIDIGKQRVSSNIDITEDIEVDITGYPSKETWFAKADELGESLLESIGTTVAIKTSTKIFPMTSSPPPIGKQELLTEDV